MCQFCDDLVDLSPCEDKGNEMQNSEIVFNPDLEGLVLPVSNQSDNYTDKPVAEFPVACTIAVPFEIRNNCPFTSGKICDLSVSFLCDTGAAITALSSALFERLPSLTKHPPSSLMPQSIRTASGESVPITGLALVPFQVGEYKYPYYAYIVDKLAYDGIIGADLSTHYQAVINFDTRKLQLPPPTDTPPPFSYTYGHTTAHTCPIPDGNETNRLAD